MLGRLTAAMSPIRHGRVADAPGGAGGGMIPLPAILGSGIGQALRVKLQEEKQARRWVDDMVADLRMDA